MSKLDPIMAGLGARKPHLPPLLAWAVLQLRSAADQASTTSSHSVTSTRTYHRLAERALSGYVFSYLQTALSCAAIQVRPWVIQATSPLLQDTLFRGNFCAEYKARNGKALLASVCPSHYITTKMSHLKQAENSLHPDT